MPVLNGSIVCSFRGLYTGQHTSLCEVECEVDRMSGCRGKWKDRRTESPLIIVGRVAVITQLPLCCDQSNHPNWNEITTAPQTEWQTTTLGSTYLERERRLLSWRRRPGLGEEEEEEEERELEEPERLDPEELEPLEEPELEPELELELELDLGRPGG